ncbi:MAG: hypothetical protein ACM3VZ_05260 [Acidobacteriota bacterium]
MWAIALVLLFEEWGWEPLARALAWIGNWPGFRWIEARIRQLPPYGALALFIVPVLALLPIKLLALYALGHGHAVLGVSVIIAAKIGGTAITARLFMLTQSTLMRLAWFARWFTRWIAWKNSILLRVRQSQAWQAVQALQQRVRKRVTGWVQALRQVFKDH